MKPDFVNGLVSARHVEQISKVADQPVGKTLLKPRVAELDAIAKKIRTHSPAQVAQIVASVSEIRRYHSDSDQFWGNRRRLRSRQDGKGDGLGYGAMDRPRAPDPAVLG
jgi:hypothetical protein